MNALGILALLILTCGFFALAEMALASSRRARLQQMAEEGDRSAARALHIKSTPSRFIAATQTGATLTPHGVDLIDENNARRLFFRLFKHIANTRSPNTDEHFNEIGPGNTKKRNLRLARNSPCEQRLAGAWVAHHQDTAGNPSTELLKLARIT